MPSSRAGCANETAYWLIIQRFVMHDRAEESGRYILNEGIVGLTLYGIYAKNMYILGG
jgi:hypothetical protein